VDHEDGLLDLDALDFVDESRKGIEAELLEESKTLWVYCAGIAVRREIKRLPIDEQRFFQLGEQDEAFHRRPESSHQQAVVATGIQTHYRRRSKPAEPIGFQPLPTQSRVQVSACFLPELNHDLSPQANVFPSVRRTPAEKVTVVFAGLHAAGHALARPAASSGLSQSLMPPRRTP